MVDPRSEPCLIDDDLIGFKASTRTADELVWAEKRLDLIGFQIREADRVKSYVDDTEDSVVYADPRARGIISCLIFKRPSRKRTKAYWARAKPEAQIQILDSWKFDLAEKYQRRLQSVLSRGG